MKKSNFNNSYTSNGTFGQLNINYSNNFIEISTSIDLDELADTIEGNSRKKQKKLENRNKNSDDYYLQ